MDNKAFSDNTDHIVDALHAPADDSKVDAELHSALRYDWPSEHSRQDFLSALFSGDDTQL